MPIEYKIFANKYLKLKSLEQTDDLSKIIKIVNENHET
jgi:hypothetical protein